MPIAGLVLMLALQQTDITAVQTLERLEHQLAATYKAGDCAAWGEMLAPEWSVIHITATTMTKAEALKACQDARPALEELRIDELNVRVYGDTAVVTGRTTAKTGGASPVSLALRFTDVFVRRDGRWLAVASQATRIGS
jgi:ketosteroid isomerase-like protein